MAGTLEERIVNPLFIDGLPTDSTYCKLQVKYTSDISKQVYLFYPGTNVLDLSQGIGNNPGATSTATYTISGINQVGEYNFVTNVAFQASITSLKTYIANLTTDKRLECDR